MLVRRAQSVKDTYEDRVAKTFVPRRCVPVLSRVKRPRQEYSTYSVIYYSQRPMNTDPKTRGLSKQLRYIPDYVRIPFVYE